MSVALLTAQLGAGARMIVEIAWGADLTADPATWVWTDVTTDVQFEGGPINISPIGRSDEYAVAQPAGCSFQVDNSTGKYSKGPQSPNYPNVRRNTPVRVRVTLNNFASSFVRFQGYATGFPPMTDTTGKVVRVKVLANGIMRRLQQPSKPLRSPLTRAALGAAASGLRQFWPCEDGAGSNQLASAMSGQPPLAGSTLVAFAAVDPVKIENLPYGTQPIADFKNGANPGATFAAGSASSWTVQIGVACYDTTGVVTTIAEWATPGGTFVRWQVVKDTTGGTFGTRLIGYNAAGTPTTICSSAFVSSAFGECTVTAAQSGGNINVTMYVALDTVSASPAGTLTGISGFTINPTSQVTANVFGVGQVRIWDGITAPRFQTTSFAPGSPNSAWWSFINETAATRLARLCTEQGVPLTIIGTSNVPMGVQAIDTFVNLVRECEATDLGVLFNGLSAGLTYVTGSSRYNPFVTLTLNAATGQVDDPFEPKDDDLGTRNRIIVTQKNGTSAIAEDPGPPLGSPMGTSVIGVYEGQAQVNISNLAASSLPNIASWLLYVGTNDEPYRYPRLNLDLSAAPSAAFGWISGIPTQGIDVTNVAQMTSQYPPGTVSVIVDGYGEQLSPFWWKVQANCSASKRWQVAALNTTFRLEMASQTLAANLAPGATTLSLATAAGHALFTTKAAFPADFPLDIKVAGWPIHVTDATGGASPQTLTIDPAPNGTTIPSGSAVTLWRPAALAL